MNGNIIWLASYPKSGNTWMRILLTNYLRNSDIPADINNLEGGPIASGRQAFDNNVGVEASDLTQQEIERYRPYVYDKISQQQASPVFIKIHDAYTLTSQKIPLIPKSATAAVLYIVRNPLDVCVSFSHHISVPVAQVVEFMADSNSSYDDNSRRLHNQLSQRLLSWSGHVSSWIDEPGLNLKLVRYEDMLTDTVAVLTDVIRFLGMDDAPQRISQAVAHSSFSQLQSQERHQSFGERAQSASAFFRTGKAGSWRDELDARLADKLRGNHEALMHRLGYDADL